VYIGGNKIAIRGMAMQGTNWTRAYGRRSSKNLMEDKNNYFKFQVTNSAEW